MSKLLEEQLPPSPLPGNVPVEILKISHGVKKLVFEAFEANLMPMEQTQRIQTKNLKFKFHNEFRKYLYTVQGPLYISFCTIKDIRSTDLLGVNKIYFPRRFYVHKYLKVTRTKLVHTLFMCSFIFQFLAKLIVLFLLFPSDVYDAISV